MSRTQFRWVSACLVGAWTAWAGGAAVAQDLVLPPPAGVVMEVAPSVEGDVFAVAPQVQSFTLTTDGVLGEAMFFAHSVGNDPVSLLDMGNVQKELDLIDEQKEKIREAQRKMHEGMQQHFTEMRALRMRRIRDLQDSQNGGGVIRREGGGGAARGEPSGAPDRAVPRLVEPPEDFKKSQERLKALRDQLAKDIDNVLLPHQKKRLEEIRLRMKMKQRGTSGSLVDTELAKTLDITDAQKERIRRRAAEVQKELEEKIAKLREQAREEILNELTPEQQTKLKDLLGAEFDDRPQPLPPPRIRRSPTPAEEPRSNERTREKDTAPPPVRGS